ncbi:hypothetical protein G5I_09198 [Acromyrmex echinatior]|uniref:Uncharacterized protein n=1 Tax=Acromyrmex echinatior TaxID=103372 RepID=F4WTK0_ACREC|nr:hypothetical protein G5I_09198 [Acromyrmex echinatior]
MENDFTKCLRQEIVKWACTLQYDECERSALRKLEHHLENHESRPQVNILTALVDIINHVYSYKNLKKVQDYVTGISYLNESQILKIVRKIQRRLSEIVDHKGHFRFMNIH